MMLKNGLIAAASLCATACAALPAPGVPTMIPDYDAPFIECVLAEYEARTYGPCTEQAVDDWSVMIDR